MKFPYNDKEYYIDGWLASALDSLAYNVKNDWDFVILITGDRGVRVGKSVLAMTVGAYLSTKIQKLNKNSYGIDHIYFDNKDLVEGSQIKPKYSIMHYDEGREGLAASKAMKGFQQDLLDFFAECGQLNHIFIIVCPDFFELKENMAVARSECLINVYRRETPITNVKKESFTRFDRGYFEFFNKRRKQMLYDMAKSTRRKYYGITKPNFKGRFTDQYPLDKELYIQKKRDSLSRFAKRHQEQKEKVSPVLMNALRLIKELKETNTHSYAELSRICGLDPKYWINNVHSYLKDEESGTNIPDSLGK